jgi:hypothetical protein
MSQRRISQFVMRVCVSRRLKQLGVGFFLAAILELVASSPIKCQGARLSLIQKWQAVLPAGRQVVSAASCPNGEIYALAVTEGVLTFDSTGKQLRDDPALLKSSIPLLAVCDAQDRLYVAAISISISIFDPDANGMLHLVGGARLNSMIRQMAVLEDGSVLVFSDTTTGSLPRHFAHDGREIKEKPNLQKTLQYSVVRGRSGTWWSAQYHAGPSGSTMAFNMEGGKIATQETVNSEIADVFSITGAKVQDASGTVIWSSDEYQELGLLVGTTSKDELLFVKKAAVATTLICYTLTPGDSAVKN